MEVILRGSVVPIRERDASVPKKLAKVIDRALDDKVKNRYQTADQFRKELAKAL